MKTERYRFLSAVLFLMILLTGCGSTITAGNRTKAAGTGLAGSLTGYVAPSAEEETKGLGRRDPKSFVLDRKKIGLTSENILGFKKEQEGHFFYDQLEDNEKQLYVEILTILNEHAEDILVSAEDSKVIEKVFACVFQDHPEIYWISGYSFCRYTVSSDEYYCFTGKYTYDKDECRKFNNELKNCLARYRLDLPARMSDYEKVKHAYEYVAKNTEYVIGSDDNQNILSVFLRGRSVCQGYAKALQYLLQEQGLQCAMVVGEVVGGDGHAWNLVKLDGNYYHVDVTWGDSAYSNTGTPDKDDVNYAYLNVTTEEISKTRTENNVLALPYCVATEDNYYVKEGLLFSDNDYSRLLGVFKQAEADGVRSVSIKCDTPELYTAIYDELVGKGNISLYVPDDVKRYSVSRDDQMLVMTFKF